MAEFVSFPNSRALGVLAFSTAEETKYAAETSFL